MFDLHQQNVDGQFGSLDGDRTGDHDQQYASAAGTARTDQTRLPRFSVGSKPASTLPFAASVNRQGPTAGMMALS